MIYFISDTHFGNKNNSKEIDQTILDSINKTVGKKDTLYFLGDFCHKGGNPKKYRKEIICENIHMILGNHDNQNKFSDKDFISVSLMQEIEYSGQKIILFHYPMRAWNKSHSKSWMLYGHVHGRLSNEDQSLGRFTLDVGVNNKRKDVEFGTPYSFKEIKKIFSDREKKFKGTQLTRR